MFQQPKINEYLASREAEQQIIGIIMVDPKLSDDIMALVAESDFFYEDTREMFNLIAQAKREGKDFGIVDLSIMREKLVPSRGIRSPRWPPPSGSAGTS